MGVIKIMDNKNVKMVAVVLVVVGALNWGLYAFGFNLVEMLLGSFAVVEKAVYVLVAVAGLLVAYDAFQKKS